MDPFDIEQKILGLKTYRFPIIGKKLYITSVLSNEGLGSSVD